MFNVVSKNDFNEKFIGYVILVFVFDEFDFNFFTMILNISFFRLNCV